MLWLLPLHRPKIVVGADAATGTNDLFLNGKLTLIRGNVYVGPTAAPNNDNDIEYSGGGASAIDVQGGQLVVNGQIRRNLASIVGVLSYNQSGGTVTINGNNPSALASPRILWSVVLKVTKDSHPAP